MIIDLTNKQIDQARQSQLMAEPGWRSVGTQYLATHDTRPAPVDRDLPPPSFWGGGFPLCRYYIPRRTSSKNSPGEGKKKGGERGGGG